MTFAAQTRDLDFFGLTADAVDRLVPAVERALRDAGFVVRHVQENPGFARLIVESGDDRTELDLGADARLFPLEAGGFAPMLTRRRQLAVDKVLAALRTGRSARLRRPDGARAAVRARSALRARRGKDRGFTPAVISRDARRIPRLRREEFELDDSQYEQLGREIDRCARARDRALPASPTRSRAPARSRPRALARTRRWVARNPWM